MDLACLTLSLLGRIESRSNIGAGRHHGSWTKWYEALETAGVVIARGGGGGGGGGAARLKTITYLIFGSLLLVWIAVTLRAPSTASKHYLALAAIAALSMLPVYHRPHDAKLLLLTLPACAMLLSEGKLTGRIAILLNSIAIGNLRPIFLSPSCQKPPVASDRPPKVLMATW